MRKWFTLIETYVKIFNEGPVIGRKTDFENICFTPFNKRSALAFILIT
jgi:hypothetical protein